MLKMAFRRLGTSKVGQEGQKRASISGSETPDVRIQSDCWGLIEYGQTPSVEGLKAGYRGEVVLKVLRRGEFSECAFVCDRKRQTQKIYRQTRLRPRREAANQ